MVARNAGGMHTQLIVNYDERFMAGSIALPGVPVPSAEGTTWEALSWREIQPEQVSATTASVLK